ncbi:hypothetical protein, partial [Stenotrophomonas sp. Sm10]|uniref:hypothetical protein n=1 Tax=Stenotrophomonas sp. Sm10 TaxID=3002754 RepID=UPI0027E549E6
PPGAFLFVQPLAVKRLRCARASTDSRLFRWAGPPAQIQPDRATVGGCKQWKKRRVLSQVPASECARWIRTGNAPAAGGISKKSRGGRQ